MEINQIRYIIKVAQLGNFSRAADKLFVTQPTLSQQIYRLEQELGFILFKRTTRSVKLTDAGKDFVKYGQNIIDDWNKLNMVMREHLDSEKGHILIGVPPTLSQLNLTHHIATFLSQHPGVKIEMIEDFSENLIAKLLLNQIDIAFLSTGFLSNNEVLNHLEYHPLVEDYLVLIVDVNHPLAGHPSVTLDDIKDLHMLMLTEQSSITKSITTTFKNNNIEPHIVCECPNLDTLIELVGDKIGVSFLTSKVAAKYEQTKIKAITIYPNIKTQTSLVLSSSGSHTPTIKAFRNYILNNSKFK